MCPKPTGISGRVSFLYNLGHESSLIYLSVLTIYYTLYTYILTILTYYTYYVLSIYTFMYIYNIYI